MRHARLSALWVALLAIWTFHLAGTIPVRAIGLRAAHACLCLRCKGPTSCCCKGDTASFASGCDAGGIVAVAAPPVLPAAARLKPVPVALPVDAPRPPSPPACRLQSGQLDPPALPPRTLS